MIYNQKEHEKLKERAKKDRNYSVVLLNMEYKRHAFLKGFDRWVE